MKNSLSCLLLGGGKSSRMGRSKGLVSYGGKPWLEAQLELLSHCPIDRLVLVLGPNFREYERQIPWLAKAHEGELSHSGLRVKVVHNLEVEKGPFSSLQMGLTHWAASEPMGPCFVLPIDTPCPQPDVWQKLNQYMNKFQAQVALPTFASKGGHPVLLQHDFIQRLLQVPLQDNPEARLDRQMYLLADQLRVRVPVDDPQVVMNLNTPDQWQAYCSRTSHCPKEE